MIESLIVVSIACLIFFGLFQVSQLYAAKAILMHSSAAAARARMVGFNDFMVYKVVRTAAIPNAGRMITPTVTRSGAMADLVRQETPGTLWSMAMAARSPSSPQRILEQSLVPAYLEADRWGDLPAILNYSNWNDIVYAEGSGSADLVLARVRQDYELAWPFVRAFYAGDRVDMDSGGETAYMIREKHYPLYLEE